MRRSEIRWALFFLSAATLLQGPLTRAETPSLRDRVGQDLILVGRVSRTPWQHMIRGDLHKESAYIDLEDGGQIVAYAGGTITCDGPVLLRGRAILTEGSSKRPGSKDICSEVQVDVGSWECLDKEVLDRYIERLAAPQASREEKKGVEEALAAAGKSSIPILIAHLGDRRVCRRERVLSNEGEMMNRAPNASPVKERWAEEEVTVGATCEAILFAIVTPTDLESVAGANFKPISAGPPFRMENWASWWARNRDKTLLQIRRELEPVIEAYRKSRGVQQVVK